MSPGRRLPVFAAIAAVLAGATVADGSPGRGVKRPLIAVQVVSPGHLPAAMPGTFLSPRVHCRCDTRIGYDQFSATTGRDLGPVVTVDGVARSSVAVMRGPAIVTTASAGPRCGRGPGGGPPSTICQAIPSSCTTDVRRTSLRSGLTTQLLAVDRSHSVTDAVPSPDGHRIAIVTGSCASTASHLAVVTPRTGRRVEIGSREPDCTGLEDPHWSADGRRILFLDGPATSDLSGMVLCPARPAHLRIASTDRASDRAQWATVAAPRGCEYLAASFDRRGIAAVAGCRASESTVVVQLDARGRSSARVTLAHDLDQAAIGVDRTTGAAIVGGVTSPIGPKQRTDAELWSFDGEHLRRIVRQSDPYAIAPTPEPWVAAPGSRPG